MNNYDLTYDWLDFLAEHKQANKLLLNEEIIKVPNRLNRARRNQPIQGIVIHHTGMPKRSQTIPALMSRSYSTNYEVDLDGKIYEYLNPDFYVAIATGNYANEHTIAIDVTTGNYGNKKGAWSDAQLQSLKLLVFMLAEKYKFKIIVAPEDIKGKGWNFWKDKGYTLFRHRNFLHTDCPSSIPLESIFSSSTPATERSTNSIQDIEGSSSMNQMPSEEDSSPVQDISENIESSKEIFNLSDKSKNKIYSKYKKYFDSLLNYLKKELKINKSVKIILEDDEENGKKVLGRTGGYINHEDKIHIFCSGRHIKDIMRSLSHEMVHHKQNLRGEFKNNHKTFHGYAQKDKHLREMEKEAYLKGNILFRDWEDNYKYRKKHNEAY